MNDDVPAVRRIATLILTILLLATTVPAVSLSPDVPDLPEVVPSAEATHNCDIQITDSTASGPGPQILGCDPCSHTDCSPSTDPCNYVDCTTHPCDFVDCNPDPGQECQKVYNKLDKALAELPVYTSSSVSECIPPPPNPTPPEVIEDAVSFTVVHPKSVFGPAPDADAAQPFTVDGHVRNELAVPALLSVEAASDTPSVCSVGGFSTSAEAQEVRRHEYVLGPNTSRADATSDVVADLVGEEAVSFSAEVTPKQVGTCTVRYDAVVRTAVGDIQISQHKASTSVLPSPDEDLDLKGMHIDAGDCDNIRQDKPAGTQTVAAGDVGVEAALEWSSSCDDVNDRWMVMNVSYRQSGTDEWTQVGGAEVGNSGTDRVEEDVTLEDGKEYNFRVEAALIEGGFTMGCVAAMLLGGFTGAGIAYTLALLLLSSNPATAALVAMVVIGALAGGALGWAGGDCDQEVIDDETYFVPVEATSQTGGDTGTVCSLLGGTALC